MEKVNGQTNRQMDGQTDGPIDINYPSFDRRIKNPSIGEGDMEWTKPHYMK